MLISQAILHVCVWGAALGQTAAGQAGPAPVIECTQDQGYTPVVPFASGGMAVPTTAPAAALADTRSVADASYVAKARKTFFVYLAAGHQTRGSPGETASPIRVSFFDHQTGTVPKPAILPVEPGTTGISSLRLTIDSQGHVWVCAGLSSDRPSVLFRSEQPNDITGFSRLAGPPLADPRLYHVASQGFLMIGLRGQNGGLTPCFSLSPDGRNWSEPRKLAAIDAGHTLATAQFQGKIGVALACYSAGQGPSEAANIYYLETTDAGQTWKTIRQTRLELPVQGKEDGLLAWDYRSVRWTVHFKDMGFTNTGRPILLYLSGRRIPADAPPVYTWTTARWVPRGWETTGMLWAADLRDSGVLFLEPRNVWQLLTARNGPAPAGSHEEIACWLTDDQGRSWYKQAGTRTSAADRHILSRVANAEPGLYALWVTGAIAVPPASAPAGVSLASQPSPAGRLMLVNRGSDAVLLPAQMTDARQQPQPGPATSRPVTRPATEPETKPGA